ncbi:spherulin-2A-like [Leguminivora glycinivorella]|uniref:spherulin-2A-like n=1 Tax=Leguminivora glycinivorella TaxID=1035111 RepID=UPI0020103E48|nr:spherulin-2A-like [Leguminivora glycinivorella]
MISKILLIFLPAVLAEINVNIFDNEVQFFGDTKDIISDAERSTFRIEDNQLKDAINKYTQGRPDDAYVKSPTPWNDLYKVYGWSEVRRTLKVRSARVLNKRSEPQILSTKKFHNGSPRPATYVGDVSQFEDNTITHKWTKAGSLSIGQKINYNVNLGVGSVGGATSFAFKSTFGEESVNTVTTKLGSKSSISITLQPGQSAVAVLTANKGSMDVEVEYEASLEGAVATNFGKTHKGHHFWSFDINGVLEAGGLPKTVVWKEVLNIGFYANESVTAHDGNGNPIH